MIILKLTLLFQLLKTDTFVFNFGTKNDDKDNSDELTHDFSLKDKLGEWGINSKICRVKCIFDRLKTDTGAYLIEFVRS
jgi:hypothetical protein